MLFCRYGCAYTEILKMDYLSAYELILYAYEQKTNDILMKRWITNYETQISFDEFKQQLGIKQVPTFCPDVKNNNEITNIFLNLKETFG